MWQWIGRGLVVAMLAVFLGSYAGGLHPLGDSLAVFRSMVAGALLLCCLCVWRWRAAWGGAALCGVLWGVHLWSISQEPARVAVPDLIIYQKNMLYWEYDETALAQDIWASGARIVTLQEVSGAHRDFLEVMADTHPYQLVCEGTAVGAVAVLSTYPSLTRTCSEPTGIAVMDVAGADGALRVRAVSVHLHWPWPYGQAERLGEIFSDLKAADLDARGVPDRVVIGGDFNMVPWGHTVAQVGWFFGSTRIGHVERTFTLFGLGLPIDHVMAGTGAEGSIEVRPLLGSDHHGVVGTVRFMRP